MTAIKKWLEKIANWPLKMKILVGVEGTFFVLLLAVAILIGTKAGKIERIELEEEKVEASISDDVEHKTGYLNVAVFGLDSRKGDLGKGNRSDTILVVSLNHETKEVKMVSVYRDTLMQIEEGTYSKANAAYSFNGPEGAVTMLNKNLDLNIDKYVSVNFNALVDVIDAVGGIDLDLTYEEVVHMNNYCVETSKVTGKSYKKIEPEEAGTYHLNGVQGVSYSRIRYTAGGDAQRTVRQRIIIGKILEKVQNLNLGMVNEIVDHVFPQVATNFSLAEIITYAKDFKQYTLAESLGFPNARSTQMLKGIGSTEVADSLVLSVEEMHRYLFGDEDYKASKAVRAIDEEIRTRIESGYYDMTPEEEEEVRKEEAEEAGEEEKEKPSKTEKKPENKKDKDTKKENDKKPVKEPEENKKEDPVPDTPAEEPEVPAENPKYEEDFYDGE